MRKGAKAYLEGALQTRKWADQLGNEHYITEIVVGRFRGELALLDSRGGGAPSLDDTLAAQEYAPSAARSSERNGGTSDAVTQMRWDRSAPDLDDEIPF